MEGNFHWNRCLTSSFKQAENLYHLLHRWVGRCCPRTEEGCRLLNEIIWLKLVWKLMLASVLNTVAQYSEKIKNFKNLLALNPLFFFLLATFLKYWVLFFSLIMLLKYQKMKAQKFLVTVENVQVLEIYDSCWKYVSSLVTVSLSSIARKFVQRKPSNIWP